jgi:putative flippase GtrA
MEWRKLGRVFCPDGRSAWARTNALILASLGLLAMFVELISIPQYLAPIVVIVCMFPVNFVAERFVLQSSARQATS